MGASAAVVGTAGGMGTEARGAPAMFCQTSFTYSSKLFSLALFQFVLPFHRRLWRDGFRSGAPRRRFRATPMGGPSKSVTRAGWKREVVRLACAYGCRRAGEATRRIIALLGQGTMQARLLPRLPVEVRTSRLLLQVVSQVVRRPMAMRLCWKRCTGRGSFTPASVIVMNEPGRGSAGWGISTLSPLCECE